MLRPAVETRPPAECWAGLAVLHQLTSPNQPPLRLVEDLDADPLPTDPLPMTSAPAAPARANVPITVDPAPAGIDPHQVAELTEQAQTWAPWFAQLLAEAVDGRRPLESLGRWLDEWALAEVSRHARLQRRDRSRHRVPLATIASLRTQFTNPRVLEVAVHIRRGRRSLGWACQLVRFGDRWRCVSVALGPAIS